MVGGGALREQFNDETIIRKGVLGTHRGERICHHHRTYQKTCGRVESYPLLYHKYHEKTYHDHIDKSITTLGDSSSIVEVKIPEVCLQRLSSLGNRVIDDQETVLISGSKYLCSSSPSRLTVIRGNVDQIPLPYSREQPKERPLKIIAFL